MAPEQLRGELDAVDARTDVYALGAILFEILTLEPLHGPGPVASMMKRALEGVEARPSRRTPSRDVPPELDAICATACARNKADRFASARALADAVEAYLSGDRDLALRKDLSKAHLTRAMEAATRALVPGASSDERRDALREVGRAIVLRPEDHEAHALFVRILSEPPKDPPPEVLEAIELSARRSQRRILPRAAAAYGLSMLLFFPLQIVAGIRNVALALLPMTLWMLAGFLAWYAYRHDHTSRRTFPYVTISACVAVAVTSVLHGPLLVVPAIGGVISMGMALQTDPKNRLFSTVMNLVAVTVPTLLAWAGLHPVKHAFVDGTMVIFPGALELPRGATFAILGGVHALIVLIASSFAGSYRDSLTRIEMRSQLVAWQLRQLVPPEAATEVERRLPDKD
jgi:serine/threonine-protein kinase